MNIEEYREYCLSKPATTEEFPFDESTLVFKVAGKLFSLTNVDLFSSINLKCDPEKAVFLREQYSSIQSGYHMNKKHWNTIQMDGSLSDAFIYELIDHSYDLVVQGLPAKQKKLLNT